MSVSNTRPHPATGGGSPLLEKRLRRGTLRIARTNRCLGAADFGLQCLDILPQLRHIPAVKDHGLKARRAPGSFFFLDRGHFFSFWARTGFDPGRASLYRNRNKAGVALARPPP